MITDPFYICLMKTGDGISVLANGDGSIAARQHCHEWVNEFENRYLQAHGRGYEGSMSACINFVMMQPSFIRVEGLDDIKARVLDPDTAQMFHHHTVAGGFSGISSKTDITELWQSGTKPALI